MADFLPGLELNKLFYQEAVKPLLDHDFPGLPHSAALLGDGSEVLGYDTEMSTDHDWGPRVYLFLDEGDEPRRDAIREALSHRLPHRFRGYPTAFEASPSGGAAPVRHRVEVRTVRGFFREHLDFDIRGAIEPADWLSFPEQKLLAVTAGAVYHDTVGLQAVRDRFAYYPRDVWLYRLAAGWMRISQEEHLMGRAGSAGDEIGSALIGSRLVRDLMRLCFLMERRYAPYPKWFGTAFARLVCAGDLSPLLRRAQLAERWPEREEHLGAACERVAAMHNALGITAPLPEKVAPFHNRPFRVIGGGAFAEAIRVRIEDPAVRRIAGRRLIGAVDQFSDSTDLLSHACWRRPLRRLYE